MNYLRGAVSAISVPYQYYRDLNPSTLTGAIDVIVISRPKLPGQDSANIPRDDKPSATVSTTPDDDEELVCSPFHVRFGKLQVLRPADMEVRLLPASSLTRRSFTQCCPLSQVNVFVNGNPVPFQMKIGDAGEAFFVFETDEDVPEDLVTSPLLEATKPGESNAHVQPPPTGRFGAKEDIGHQALTDPPSETSQEPDFLDLNAAASNEKEPSSPPTSISPKPSGLSLSKPPHSSLTSEDDEQDAHPSSFLSQTAELGKAVLGAAREIGRTEKDKLKDKTVKDAVVELIDYETNFVKDSFRVAESAPASDSVPFGEDKGDEVLPEVPEDGAQPPEVVYTHGKHISLHARWQSSPFAQ